MAALGIETKRGIASAHEVRSARGREQQPEPPRIEWTPDQEAEWLDRITGIIAGADVDGLRKLWSTWHKQDCWPQIEPLIEDRRAQLAAT